jgi:hypothetical protein
MALDLRTARIRKDPTLLVSNQKRASTSFFVAATVYLDTPTLAFDCRTLAEGHVEGGHERGGRHSVYPGE